MNPYGSRVAAARRNQAERDGRALSTALSNVIGDLHPGSLKNFLDRRFRKIAKKTAVKAYDAEQVG